MLEYKLIIKLRGFLHKPENRARGFLLKPQNRVRGFLLRGFLLRSHFVRGFFRLPTHHKVNKYDNCLTTVYIPPDNIY